MIDGVCPFKKMNNTKYKLLVGLCDIETGVKMKRRSVAASLRRAFAASTDAKNL
jgi:hypothetical protein